MRNVPCGYIIKLRHSAFLEIKKMILQIWVIYEEYLMNNNNIKKTLT